jgi:hypothetical protein
MLLVLVENAVAQPNDDAGLPDSVIVGNVDRSMIVVGPGEVVRIPVWVKTDDSVTSAFIPVAIQLRYFTNPLGEEDHLPLPCTLRFWEPYYYPPQQPAFIVFGLMFVGFFYIPTCYLLTDYTWWHIADFLAVVRADTSIWGDTSCTLITEPQNHGILFGLNDGVRQFIPAYYYGCLRFVSYFPGDANNNGEVNGVDITFLVNYLKGYGPEPDPLLAADANGNCQVNGVDVNYLVNYLKGLGQGPIRGDCR